MPLLEETGHMPTEKYAHAPEILEHCQRIGKQFGLYDNALFHTEVTDLEWDDDRSRWIVRTNRGDEFTAQFVGMGTGPLHVPKLPGHPRHRGRSEGHSFHTSRWDYDYTGGDPRRRADGQARRQAGRASSAPAPPRCSASRTSRRPCEELYVFQRTPSSVDVRDNRPDRPGVVRRDRDAGLAAALARELHRQPDRRHAPTRTWCMDGWTDLARRIRGRIMALPPDEFTPEKMMAAFEDSDFEKMEEIRARVDAIVEDPETAAEPQGLVPPAVQAARASTTSTCRRTTSPARTSSTPTARASSASPRTAWSSAGVEYEVDCIIYASGFEVGTAHTRRAGYDMTGRDGVTLSEYWADGMRTMHGMHVHGFPNAVHRAARRRAPT